MQIKISFANLERRWKEDQQNVGGAHAFHETTPHRRKRFVFIGGRFGPIVMAIDATAITDV